MPFAYGPRLSLLYPEAVLCLSGTNIPPPSPGSFPLLPRPLSPVCLLSLPSIPLGQIHLLCAENLVLECLVLTPVPS